MIETALIDNMTKSENSETKDYNRNHAKNLFSKIRWINSYNFLNKYFFEFADYFVGKHWNNKYYKIYLDCFR